MNIEVELKLKIENRSVLIHSLNELGFTETNQVMETDIYYTAAHHDFTVLDEALRVRTIQNLITGETSAVMTYKGAKLDTVSMARKELETGIADAAVCREILEQIGFSPLPVVEKNRQYLHLGHVTACVDTVSGLGDYLELEILTDGEGRRADAVQELEQILNKLGYAIADTTRISYLSMLLHKRKSQLADVSIRPAVEEDLPAILSIYAHARQFMAAHGNPRQWNSTWPPEELIREDIRIGRMYAAVVEGEVAAVFVYLQGVDIDPTYRKIEHGDWAKPGEYGVVHRLASGGCVPGIGEVCLNWAFEQCHYVRIDTHGDNKTMQHLLKRLGFVQRGIIYVEQDTDARLAYDKTV